MKTLLLCVALLASLHQQVSAFSGGAPASACDTLSPNPQSHGAQPQTSAVPYSIDLANLCINETLTYYPGRTYTLGLVGNNGAQFRGFFIQARLMAEDTTRIGYFGVAPPSAANTQLSSCTPITDGITHNENSNKNSIYYQWTAPANGTGSFRFGFAVVQVQNTYWANQRSPVIAEAGSGETGAACSTATEAPVTTAGTSQLTSVGLWAMTMVALGVAIKTVL